MTSFEFGEVILVSFPFTDQSTTKKRPAIVISSQTYHLVIRKLGKLESVDEQRLRAVMQVLLG